MKIWKAATKDSTSSVTAAVWHIPCLMHPPAVYMLPDISANSCRINRIKNKKDKKRCMRNATYNAFSLSFYRSNSLFLYYQSIRTFFQKKINSDESVFGQPQLPKILHYTNLVAQKMLYWPNCQYSIFYLYDIYLQNFIQVRSYLAVTIQFLIFGQALKRLVTVSSMCCHTSTSALSTSYSSRVFTSLKEWDISSWGGLHA